MSVAECLGVDDLDGPQMRDVRARWPQWTEAEPALLRRGAVETEATVALVWLLVPGASRLARRISDLSVDIDLARRRDETWVNTVPVDRFTEALRAAGSDPVDVSEQLDDLLQRVIDSGVLTGADRDLLLDLAHAAHRLGAPLQRGRVGLTTPSVAELVAADHDLAVRSICRHAASAIDKIKDAGSSG